MIYGIHLHCCAQLKARHNGKRGEPTCKCADWCFLWWRVQCGSYQDRLVLTVGLPHHPPHPHLHCPLHLLHPPHPPHLHRYLHNGRVCAWGCCFTECPKGCSALRCRSLSPFEKNNFANPRRPSSMNPWLSPTSSLPSFLKQGGLYLSRAAELYFSSPDFNISIQECSDVQGGPDLCILYIPVFFIVINCNIDQRPVR